MIRGKRRGSRKPRIVLAGAVAAIAAMALAGPAQATTTPQLFQFDHGRLKLGGSPDPLDIVETATPANWVKLTADVCTDTMGGCAAVNDFTITPANFKFPAVTSDVSGVPGETATVNLTPLQPVTGHYDFATGAMTTNATNYESDITLAGPIAAACKVAGISLAFSTAKQTPFIGDPFDPLGVLGEPRNGVIDADWGTLPTPTGNPTPGPDDSKCSSILNVFTTGPGGIALGRDINPVAAQTGGGGGGAVTPPPAAKKKKCKKGQKKVKVHGKIKCKKKKKKKKK